MALKFSKVSQNIPARGSTRARRNFWERDYPRYGLNTEKAWRFWKGCRDVPQAEVAMIRRAWTTGSTEQWLTLCHMCLTTASQSFLWSRRLESILCLRECPESRWRAKGKEEICSNCNSICKRYTVCCWLGQGIWLLPNCYVRLSCSPDFQPWNWRWYTPPKRRFL
jgi:hypothetical protein